MKLKIGSPAPDIALPDQDGRTVKLADFRGLWTLVYFYPKDDTPGCTKEACALRDNFPKFSKLKAKVLGISKDSAKSHAKFRQKYKLPFTLLADEDTKVQQKYGVWQEKSLYGRKYMGTVRSSFLVDPTGNIAKIYEKVKPETHAEEVIEDLKVMSKQ